MPWTSQDIPNLEGKCCIVTGANSGIGYETALQLGKRGAHVLLACRDKAKGESALQNLKKHGQFTLSILDLADLHSVKAFAARTIRELSKLDILINNAGIMMTPSLTFSKDGFELQMGTNHFGHFALTAWLMPLLNKASSPRVVTVSSTEAKMASIDLKNLDFKNGFYWPIGPYRTSKLCNLLFTMELQNRANAAKSKLIAIACHPGYAATNLFTTGAGASSITGFFMGAANTLFAQSAEYGALPVLFAATSPDAKEGAYYGPDGLGELSGYPTLVPFPPLATDKETAKKVWEVSELRTNTQFLFK